MKKLLVAIFSGALIAAFSMTADASLGFKYAPKKKGKACHTSCTSSCRNYRKIKCTKVLSWRKKCHNHYSFLTKKCKTFVLKRKVCKMNKKCWQKCVKHINNKGAYVKCYGKVKCRYFPGCRTQYWKHYKVCRPVFTKHRECHKRPVWTRRCWLAKKPGWCTSKCTTVCRWKR